MTTGLFFKLDKSPENVKRKETSFHVKQHGKTITWFNHDSKLITKAKENKELFLMWKVISPGECLKVNITQNSKHITIFVDSI